MINIYKLLENAPIGARFYSLCFGEVEFKATADGEMLIFKSLEKEKYFKFDKYGRLCGAQSEDDINRTQFHFPQKGDCMLYPSKPHPVWDEHWQDVVMPQCDGCVIVDANGFSYLIDGNSEQLYPTNPNVKDEIIRLHKFNFKGSRFATPTETLTYLSELKGNGFYWDNAKRKMKMGGNDKAFECVVCKADIDCITRDGKKAYLEEGTPLFVNRYSKVLSSYNLVDLNGDEYAIIPNLIRPWTVNDAKNGDILYDDKHIIIFDCIHGNLAYYHAILHRDSNKVEDTQSKSYSCMDKGNLKFADNDIRRTMFETMEKNGLYWNEKDKIIYHSNNGYPKYGVDDRIKYNGDVYLIRKLEKHGYGVFGVDGGECTGIGYNTEVKEVPFTVDELKPFDKVLVRMDGDFEWCADLFGYYERLSEGELVFHTLGECIWMQCVPYNEKTKHLLGKRTDYIGKYKTW